MPWSVGIDYIDQNGDHNCDMMMYGFKHYDDAMDCVAQLKSIDGITHVYVDECSMDDYHEIHDMCIPSPSSIW